MSDPDKKPLPADPKEPKKTDKKPFDPFDPGDNPLLKVLVPKRTPTQDIKDQKAIQESMLPFALPFGPINPGFGLSTAAGTGATAIVHNRDAVDTKKFLACEGPGCD